MKKKLFYKIVLAVVIVLIAACNDDKFLNLNNPGVYNPSEVWNDEKLTDAYVVNLYGGLPGWPVNDGNNADEGVGILIADAVNANNSTFKYWPYTEIRKLNILLNEIDGGSLAEDKKSIAKAQAYFIRAFHYFKAVVYHGGVPIITEPQSLNDDLMVARNSTSECFDFIIDDLDKAIAGLADKNRGADYGRIDKAAAKAFKGRVLLYKASPQFNPSNPYDNAYWADAYTATKDAKDFLDANGYGLYPTYDGIFMNKQHQEDVMVVAYKANTAKQNGRQEHCVRPLTQSKDCTGGDNPIWNLVESYPMKDGKMPGASIYPYDVQTFWENRDPRFDATIAYNGSIFPLGVSANRKQYTDLQIGGLDDGFGPGETFARSGFYTRKGVDNSLPQAQVGLNQVDWIEIRYAEVLLNYAEAANETGHSSDAVDVLKQIRQRAGIEPGGDNMYGLATGMSRDQVRDAIMHERYIEFTFEGKRFWDLRRTRRLNELNGEHKYGLLAQLKSGLDPTGKPAYYFNSDDFNYTVTELITSGPKEMFTPDSYYFFPISQTELQKDPNLKQNKDWGGDFDPVLN
ncbi:MAG: RagB/SusD family nutrient uptake outer membrane protein [Agriterribacter sp.]